MADENDEETTETGGEGGKETGKQLRTKLENALSENATLKAQNMLYEAGLGHLSAKQRNAVVRDASEDGAEVTVEVLKKSAKELGFPEAPKAATETQSTNGKETGAEGETGEASNTAEQEALNSMEAIEQAQRRAVPVIADGSFEQKMAKATSQAEVEALIRSEGHKVGIVHEWDVE